MQLRLGLRAQILIALSVALSLAFVLLWVVAVQLSRHAQQTDRIEQGRALARLLATALETNSAHSEKTALLSAAVEQTSVVGIEAAQRKFHLALGEHRGPRIEHALIHGGRLTVWLGPSRSAESTPLARLLLLYAIITGAGILLLAYVALTRWIVLPIDALTRTAERLPSGASESVPIRGPSEVARLASSFNAMVQQLARERTALQARLKQLEATSRELEQAHQQVVHGAHLASVGRLAAGVAHEIGNPMAAIIGLLELLRSGDLEPDEQAEFLRRMQIETGRIHKIIRQLLDFARRGGPDDGDNPGPVDVAEVVEDAVRLIAPQKDLGRINIERRFDPHVPPVRADRDRLTQVILNLLLNAADAIEGDGDIHIEVRNADRRGFVLLVVADTGPGIAPEVRDQLFEPFATTKPPGEGTGLGLAVCHAIVERLGGTIRAQDGEFGGARFEVQLPVA